MLEFLRNSGKATDRKLRLFAVACCRQLFREVRVDLKDVHAVDVAERYADGDSTAVQLDAAVRYVPGPPSARRTAAFACRDAASRDGGVELADCTSENAAWAAGEHAASLVSANNDSPEFAAGRAAEQAEQATLLRDLFGRLRFREVVLDLAWLTGTVRGLGEAAYQERQLPDGTLDPDRLAVLADALEDAGAGGELMDHLRGPGPHWRSCWAIDKLTGRQ
jgi:hypothetical protein